MQEPSERLRRKLIKHGQNRVNSLKNTIDEQLLAVKAKQGDNQAFEMLVEHFTPRLRSFLLRRMPDRLDVEDAIQETFLKVHLNISAYDENHRFTCWLFTIAARTAMNIARVKKPCIGVFLEDVEADISSPYQDACRSDDKMNIWKIAASLEEKQYTAVYLKYAEGFSTAEIAALMNTSKINTRVLLHRARNTLMKKLKQYETQGL